MLPQSTLCCKVLSIGYRAIQTVRAVGGPCGVLAIGTRTTDRHLTRGPTSYAWILGRCHSTLKGTPAPALDIAPELAGLFSRSLGVAMRAKNRTARLLPRTSIRALRKASAPAPRCGF